MKRYTDDNLDLLLARGELKGPREEKVRADLIAGVAAERRRRSLLHFVPGVVVAACAAIILLALPKIPRPHDALRAKGGPLAVSVQLSCIGGGLDSCPRGSTLLFTALGGDPDPAYITAYAEPRGRGERVWYFSADDAPDGSRLAPGPGSRALAKEVVLGSEHAPGAYEVRVVVGPRPLHRAEALASTHQSLDSQRFHLEVTE
jgi:hypothetical protein